MPELRLILLGPPGAGKGTQARILEQRFGAAQVSTGDILRQNRQERTELGLQAQRFMDAGELVPDELIVAMIERELGTRRSFIMDGFPRTVGQAEAFDALLTRLKMDLTAAVAFTADADTLIGRLSSRWTNPRTGRTYNSISDPPRVAGIDDHDGGPLVQREDDRAETVANRLSVYERQTAPLIDYYRKRGKLVEVNALLDPGQVTAAIVSAVLPAAGLAAS